MDNGHSDGLKLKSINDGFVYYKHTTPHFTRCKLIEWRHVDYLWVIVFLPNV